MWNNQRGHVLKQLVQLEHNEWILLGLERLKLPVGFRQLSSVKHSVARYRAPVRCATFIKHYVQTTCHYVTRNSRITWQCLVSTSILLTYWKPPWTIPTQRVGSECASWWRSVQMLTWASHSLNMVKSCSTWNSLSLQKSHIHSLSAYMIIFPQLVVKARHLLKCITSKIKFHAMIHSVEPGKILGGQ